MSTAGAKARSAGMEAGSQGHKAKILVVVDEPFVWQETLKVSSQELDLPDSTIQSLR